MAKNKMLLNAVVILGVLNLGYSYVSDSSWDDLEELLPRYKDKDKDNDKGKASSPKHQATPCPPLKLPLYQPISASDLHQLLFKPARNHRLVSDVMKSILLPTNLPKTTPPASTQKNVELLCHLDRIYVRVSKNLFTSLDAQKYLKVGSCFANRATPDHYYFLNSINSCDVKRQDHENYVSYSNKLTYEPESTEPVVRELPFSVPLECRYSKYFRSYSVGFHPQVESGTVFLSLQTGVSITPVDVNFLPLGTVQTYSIGEPMFFEAKAPHDHEGKRLYVSKCYVTASQDPTATPKYTVVDNYGCLVDGKNTPQSKFYPSDDKTTLKFSVAAVMFKDMVSQPKDKMEMFIHCEISLGPEIATRSTKSCSYDRDSQSWSGLYGEDAVCDCCDTSCPAPDPSVNMKIASNSWKVKSQSQPTSKLREEALNHGGFEAFWDSFYESVVS